VFVDPVRVFQVVSGLGVEPERGAFEAAEQQARLQLVAALSEGARGTEEHVWQGYFLNLLRATGVPPHLEQEANRRLREAHAAENLWTHVAAETPAALRELRDMGYRLGVVSNADGRVEALLRSRGLADYFEFVIDSHVFGVEKPDPRIFRAAVERLALEPRACLYVGDLYPVDVLGARAAGLEALLLDPWDHFDLDVDRIPTVAHLPRYLASRG
jgi:putative hydrolase of the HAD superfamily